MFQNKCNDLHWSTENTVDLGKRFKLVLASQESVLIQPKTGIGKHPKESESEGPRQR